MALSLQKGGNLSLSKAAPGLTNITVGLGWDARSTDGAAFDLDASAVLLAGDKVRNDSDFVFYGQKQDADASVIHGGDNLTGEGDGDDETIDIHLDKVPAEVDRVVVAATIYDYETRNQSFGQVRNAYIRIVNADNGEELARYDLAEDYALETGVLFGEVYRNGADWKFKAVGQGYADGLGGIGRDFGVNI